MRENMKKKSHYLAFLVLVEILLLFFLCIRGKTRELYEIRFDGKAELPYYVGEVYGLEQAIVLRRGSYMIKIRYESDVDAWIATRMTKSYGPGFADTVTLAAGDSEKEFELFFFGDVKDFYLYGDEPVAISEIEIRETRQWDKMLCVLLLFFFVCTDLYFWQRERHILEELPREKKTVILAVLLIGCISSLPLFTNYLPQDTDDMTFHLMRIEGIAQGIREGQFPVKMQPLWVLDHSYPVSVMYGDLFLYIPAVLRLLGFPLQTVFKIYTFLVNMGTAAVAYYCAKKVSGSYKTGLVMSLVYTLSVYRLTNLYYRYALGEYTAMLFLPLVFCGLRQLFLFEGTKQERQNTLCLLIFAYTGLLESHLLGFLMTVIFSAIYCILHWNAFVRNFISLVGAAFVTILLNVWFLVPMLDFYMNQSMNMLDNQRFNMQEWGLFIPQIFQMFSFSSMPGGYYSVSQGILEERLYGMGISYGWILVLFLWEMLVCKKELWNKVEKKIRIESWCCFGLTLLAIVCTTYYFPWRWVEDIPLLGTILAPYQFSWRFTMIANTFGLFLGAYVLENLRHVTKNCILQAAASCLCALAFVSGIYRIEESIAKSVPKIYTSAQSMDTRAVIGNGEYLPKDAYTPMITGSLPEAEEGVLITEYQKILGKRFISYDNTTEKTCYIKVPLYNYYGYHAYDMTDGHEYYIGTDGQGVMMVIVEAKRAGQFCVMFEKPHLWILAEKLSFGIFLLLMCVIWKRKAERKHSQILEG